MGKGKIIIAMCLLTLTSSAQNEDYIRPGLLAASLTVSPSWMLNRDEVNYNLTGFLEGHLDKHISLRGETHYFLDGKKDSPFLKLNSRTLFGVQYHLNKNNLDGHIGLLPGLSIMQVNGVLNTDGRVSTHVVPTISMKAGVSYYVWKIFHFFADVTYVHSSIHGMDQINGRADELYISAGLGFNVNTIREK